MVAGDQGPRRAAEKFRFQPRDRTEPPITLDEYLEGPPPGPERREDDERDQDTDPWTSRSVQRSVS